MAAIATHCNLEVYTKIQQDDIGYHVSYNTDGSIKSKEEALGLQDGTIMKLKNLFCTVPVRKIQMQKNGQM